VPLAFVAGIPWLIPVAAGVYPLLRFRRWAARRQSKGLQPVTAAIAVYMSLTAAFAFQAVASPELYAFWSIPGLVILLNLDFYRFLRRRMGGLEALAAIPFHLLFHLYNGISLIAGVVKYFLKGRARGAEGLRLKGFSGTGYREQPEGMDAAVESLARS
jgi:hypothetical protein